jgi:hypothetical protein
MSDLILAQFQNSLTSFFDEMIDLFPKEADFIKIRIYLKDQVDMQTVMDVFNYNLNRVDVNHDMTLKKMIKDRKDMDIIDSPILLEFFSKDKIIYYKKFWNSPNLFSEDKKMIWKWVDSFVGISDRYIKTK